MNGSGSLYMSDYIITTVQIRYQYSLEVTSQEEREVPGLLKLPACSFGPKETGQQAQDSWGDRVFFSTG